MKLSSHRLLLMLVVAPTFANARARAEPAAPSIVRDKLHMKSDDERACTSGAACTRDDARDAMMSQVVEGAGRQAAAATDKTAGAADKAVLARGCDRAMAQRASDFIPPAIGSPLFVATVTDDDFIAKLESRSWDVVFFAPGACRYSEAGQPIPGGNAHTAGWSLAEYRTLVRKTQGNDVAIVETTREVEIVPKLRMALGLDDKNARSSRLPAKTDDTLRTQDLVDPPLQIGTTKQLLFDDWIVQQLSNGQRATTTLHPTLVLQADAPWEAGYAVQAAGGIVKEENGTVRLWYTIKGGASSEGVTAVAISDDDGSTFVKPLLGLRPDGPNNSTANNFLRGNAMAGGTQNVWLDHHATDNNERYVGQHEDALSGEIVLTVSADGLHWQEKSRWNFQGNADSRASIFFDSWIDRYVLITRNWYFLPTPSEWRKPCPSGSAAAPNCSQPPSWSQPSFRRVRRLEAPDLSSYPIATPRFTKLELGVSH